MHIHVNRMGTYKGRDTNSFRIESTISLAAKVEQSERIAPTKDRGSKRRFKPTSTTTYYSSLIYQKKRITIFLAKLSRSTEHLDPSHHNHLTNPAPSSIQPGLPTRDPGIPSAPPQC